ncbi:hypothetical protein CLV62_11483 [Dysgonomonas alginatilytica]|uniref:PKD domain-containing protein n=1 Tax=Dysgonomonas alginatilytica TaxID=1605892 RepID=A0A2V3PMS8_9BACT|nr:hypothetical protein [Dysgonomonas alginatilytica]PXV63366.1 hypothetical protein CLV62_11483 [Dysgonomonas alginatilytica]
MKKIILILLISMCLPALLQAQKEMNNWAFGVNAGLTWNTTRSITLTGLLGTANATLAGLPTSFKSSINTVEGCFSLSDNDGKLLFYSDGITIWDTNGKAMPGSLNPALTGHSSSAQSGIIFPYPGSTTKFVAVTLNIGTVAGNTAAYSVVDMSLKGNGTVALPLGDVITTQKNIKLPNGVGAISESCTATLGADGSYWIIAPGRGNPTQFNAWKFTEAGIAANPVVSTTTFSSSISIGACGYIKISYDGKHFAWGQYSDGGLVVGDFNNATGVFTNIRRIVPGGTSIYGIEFSPSLKYLYTGGYAASTLSVYDFNALLAGTSTTPLRLITTLPGTPYNPQLGPDKRLYIATYSTNCIVIVDNPDDDPSLWRIYQTDNTTFLQSGTNNQIGFPSFMGSWFAGKAKPKNFQCTANSHNYSITVDMSGVASQLPVKLEWDFGDGTTKVTQPIAAGTTIYKQPHTYTSTGVYTITITPIKADNTTLSKINMQTNVTDCPIQTNPIVRTNLYNSLQQ